MRRLAAALLVLALAACGLAPSPTPLPSPSPSATPLDLVAPSIVAQDPPPGAEIATGGVVRVTFSEPVEGVDGSSFQIAPAGAAALPATVTLSADGLSASLTPTSGLTIGSAYAVTLTARVHDVAGNPLPPLAWELHTGNLVQFAAGTYDGFKFGASSADLTDFRRGTLAEPSSATASGYRELDGNGYLVVASGDWAGYWVPGTPFGVALDDASTPIPPLPTCAYLDLSAARTDYADWGSSVLDTVFRLARDYVPPDLTDTRNAGLNGGYYVRAVALDDLTAMVAAAKADGVGLAVESAYRSYKGQVLTFNGWVSQVGYKQALITSARPGHSEHQLGTAIDFRAAGGASAWNYPDWATTREGAWLAANAWTYGWVMSYPKGANGVACYRYEPWHYRYVGRAAAAAIHDAGVTTREWLWAQGYGIR